MRGKNENVVKRRKAEESSTNQRAFCEIERIAGVFRDAIVESLLALGSSKVRQIYQRQIEREHRSEKLFVAIKRECHSQRIVARDKCIQALAQNGFIQFAVQMKGKRFIEAAVRLRA